MTSFRGRRVVIASLFLPNTAVLGESPPPTPDRHETGPQAPPLLVPAVTQRLADKAKQPRPAGPLKSIVDDLKDKSRNPTPAARSPTHESLNPFSNISLPDAPITRLTAHSYQTKPPPSVRRHATERPPRRQQSRSSSRRAVDSDALRPSGSNDPWHIEQNPHCNGGLKNAVDSVSHKLRKKLWVGTLGTNTDSFPDDLRRNIDRRMVSHNDSLPVWIPDSEFQACYAEFCHQVLWPCLHYAIPDAPRTKLFSSSASFAHYVAVNQRFAAAIIAAHSEGDIIWVNDYHLMLLPLLLRSSPAISPHTPIGFFMHAAFPSSEIFRCLSVRQDLLRGVMGADMVGFQTANYARHFRQTVSRIMAWEALPRGIQVPEGDEGGILVPDAQTLLDGPPKARARFVDVGVFPMGIDVWQLREKKAEQEVQDWVQVLTQRYAGMKIVVGRDKLDEIQGVRHKIQAFEYFLDKYPEFQGQAVLIQVALHTTESHSLAGAVADSVSRINSRFSTLTYQPVVFLHTQDLTFSQYLALLSVADAFIVTSLREGMALRTHEYVECQEGRWRPLILSEFTGSYSYSGFRSCIAINPWDTRGTAAAINQALTMPEDEARTRWSELHSHVTTQTAQAFVTTFLNRCVRAHAEHMQDEDEGGLGGAVNGGIHGGIGGGGGANNGGINNGGININNGGANNVSRDGPTVLDMARVVTRYRHSGSGSGDAGSWRRVVVVDLEGALWRRDEGKVGKRVWAVKEEGEEGAVGIGGAGAGVDAGAGADAEKKEQGKEPGKGGKAPAPASVDGGDVPDDAVEVLRKLSQDKRNEVWVLSGLRVKGALERLAEKVPAVGIVAENGCFIKNRKTRSSVSPHGDWVNMVANFNLTWRSACIEMLNYFTERTPGSFVEAREASIVWRFWTGDSPDSDCADRQWARRQAAEAQNHIFDSLGERYGLRIIPGKNSFLVLPNNISRSAAVGAILYPGGPAHSPLSGRAAWMSPDATEAGGAPGGDDFDFLLVISGDEKLLRRLNEFDGAETCSSRSGRATDAKWRVEPEKVVEALTALVGQ